MFTVTLAAWSTALESVTVYTKSVTFPVVPSEWLTELVIANVAVSSLVIVPVPVETPKFKGAPREDHATTDPASQPPAAPAAPTPVQAESPGAPQKSHGVGGLCYRAVDTVLWAINRPFEWLSPGARRLTGAVAIVTLVTSLLAPYLLPLLSPPRHH